MSMNDQPDLGYDVHIWTDSYDPDQWPFQDDCARCRQFRDTFLDWVGTSTGMHFARDHMREHNIVFSHSNPNLTKKQRQVKAQQEMHAKSRRQEQEVSMLRGRIAGLEKLNDDLTAACDEYDRHGSIPVSTLRLLQRKAMGGF